jgi:hypothetical protein
MIAALLMAAATAQVHAGGIDVGSGNWQPSYSGFWSTITITYYWTNEDLRPIKDANGKNIGGSVVLKNDDKAAKIPVPANAYDVAWQAGWSCPNTGNFCATNADSMALSQVGGVWVSDGTAGLAASQGGDLEWQSGFLDLNLNATLYYDVDLTAYYAGGAPLYPDDASMIFQIVNGTSPELPGYLFGTSPISLDPINGLVTANPYTGDVTSVMQEGVCTPEPPTMSLCAILLLALAWSTIRSLGRKGVPSALGRN